MSTTLRELKNRINAAKNIQQITRAMKLISAAKMRKLEGLARNFRRYLEVLQLALETLPVESLKRSILINPEENGEVSDKPVGLMILTADRGLCGAFNNNIINTAMKRLRDLGEDNAILITVGRKACNAFKAYRPVISVDRVPDYPSYDFSTELASQLGELYRTGRVARIEAVAPRYISTTRYEVRNQTILPLQLELDTEGKGRREQTLQRVELIEPSTDYVSETLVAMIFRAKVHSLLLELKATEYGARLAAMTNATENAENLIRELRLLFFKKRQEQITRELMDIVEASEGLKARLS